MDVVVADVPAKFGMLLSRSCSAKQKGTMQMDFSYATIPIFGVQRRLYRESRLKYMINSKEFPENRPIYVVDTKMGSAIFYNLEHTNPEDHLIMINQKREIEEMKEEACVILEDMEKWFTMHFDGACSKEGVGARVTISNPYYIEQTGFSYKFYFSCTNNLAEYEALILGLQILKKLEAKRVYIYGDSELVLR